MISNEEEKINLIDQEMCKVEIYENPNKIVELTKAREAAKLKSEKLYEQLINLTEE
jgi:ATP-binding cassette subfamily F protein 3